MSGSHPNYPATSQAHEQGSVPDDLHPDAAVAADVGYAAAEAGGHGEPEEQHPGAKKKRKVLRRTLLAVLFFILLCGVGGVAAFAIGYAMTPIPDPNRMVTSNTSIVYFNDGKTPMGSYASRNRVTVPLSEVPKHVQDSMLSAENRSFWSDRGVSVSGIARALWADATGGDRQGASTITQQYVKNYYLSQERTWERKTKELFITLKVQRKQSKQEILQDYLNTIYFGRGAYGIQTASQEYFGKPVDKLTVEEGATLASMARAPSNYDPHVDPDNADRLEGRFRYVMQGLAEMNEVSAKRAENAKVPKIEPIRDDEQYAGYKGYLLSEVRDELGEMGYSDQEIESGGLRVRTTFDKSAMDAAKRAVEKNKPTDDSKGVHTGLASVDPKTGGVVAIYGGKNYLKRSFNDAMQAKIEPGSTFKPFALAGALEKNIPLDSRFAGNSPFYWGSNGKVNNEYNEDYGSSVSLLEATEKSINTAYVDLTVNQLGPSHVKDAAVKAGIPRNAPGLHDNALVALGNASTTPVELANAYATFANGGVRHDPHVVDRVETRTGEVKKKVDTEGKRTFDRDVVRDVNYALQQVVRSGTGYTASEMDRPVAGKTGTHEDLTAWFSGYTPQLATSVGFYREDGNGNRDSLDGVGGMSTFTGSGYPTDIFTAFMEDAMKGKPVKGFADPAWVGKDSDVRETGAPTLTAEPTSPDEEPTDDTSSPTPTPTDSESPEPTPTETIPSPDPTTEEPSPTETVPPPDPTTEEPEPTETEEPSQPPDPTYTPDDDDPTPPGRRSDER